MFEKLKNVEDRYEEINNRLMDPAVVGDNEQYKNLMKEYKNLTPIVEAYRSYRKARETVEEFARRRSAHLTVLEGGEHWLHTPAQLAALRRWERERA